MYIMNFWKIFFLIPFFSCLQQHNFQAEQNATIQDSFTAAKVTIPDAESASTDSVQNLQHDPELKPSAHIKSLKSAENIVDPSTWKGVNMPLQINWKTKNSLSQKDFDYAAEAGANVIRLSVHADPEENNYSKFLDIDSRVMESGKSQGLADLASAVDMAEKDGLKVIIDMHTMPGTKAGKIWNDSKYWDVLSSLWTAVAEKFKNNNAVVAFDLMNEPGIISAIQKGSGDIQKMFKGTWTPPPSWKGTARDYNLQITKLIATIRKTDPERYVIVEGFGYLGNPINFSWMQPIKGFDKIIYSFHMYVPTGLTMLGTASSDNKPGKQEIKPFLMPQDVTKIDKAFEPVLAFQKKYNVPIYVGEFGITDEAVFGKNASGQPYNGACWLATVIEKMNSYHWGWTYWDFWTEKRKPDSKDDPRYQILSAAMKGEKIKDYCH